VTIRDELMEWARRSYVEVPSAMQFRIMPLGIWRARMEDKCVEIYFVKFGGMMPIIAEVRRPASAEDAAQLLSGWLRRLTIEQKMDADCDR